MIIIMWLLLIAACRTIFVKKNGSKCLAPEQEKQIKTAPYTFLHYCVELCVLGMVPCTSALQRCVCGGGLASPRIAETGPDKGPGWKSFTQYLPNHIRCPALRWGSCDANVALDGRTVIRIPARRIYVVAIFPHEKCESV